MVRSLWLYVQYTLETVVVYNSHGNIARHVSEFNTMVLVEENPMATQLSACASSVISINLLSRTFLDAVNE